LKKFIYKQLFVQNFCQEVIKEDKASLFYTLAELSFPEMEIYFLKNIRGIVIFFRRSPPDAAFASSGGHAVSLPAAGRNAFVRFVLEFLLWYQQIPL
jgi:hypothetical protein